MVELASIRGLGQWRCCLSNDNDENDILLFVRGDGG